jgi:uncharacterized protein (DUF1697 family)
MTVYVALLRSINVGGKNKIPMNELRTMFETLGHGDVVSYIQSGNVVFTSSSDAVKVTAGITKAIGEELGLRVPVVVRTRAELAGIVRANPYVKAGADVSKLHVMFLADKPTKAAIADLDPDRSPPDEFTVQGTEIYLLAPNGVGRSKLTVDYFDKHLGTTGTSRNWKTVNTLLDLMAR